MFTPSDPFALNPATPDRSLSDATLPPENWTLHNYTPTSTAYAQASHLYLPTRLHLNLHTPPNHAQKCFTLKPYTSHPKPHGTQASPTRLFPLSPNIVQHNTGPQPFRCIHSTLSRLPNSYTVQSNHPPFLNHEHSFYITCLNHVF
jgi:hypothetical protein